MSNSDSTLDSAEHADRSALRGSLDHYEGGRLFGWAALADSSDQNPLELELLVDGQVVSLGVADQPRADVEAATLAPLHCGFSLIVPVDRLDGLAHRLEVRAPATGHLVADGLVAILEAAPTEAEAPPEAAADERDDAARAPTDMLEPALAPGAVEVAPARQRLRSLGLVGRLDGFRTEGFVGWAARTGRHAAAVDVELVIDGTGVARTTADLHRADLEAAGIGDGRHGFRLQPPEEHFDDREHTVSVREVASGAELEGSPQTMRLHAAHLWDQSVDDDPLYRRRLADRALDFCEAAADEELDAELHAIVLRLLDWAVGQNAARVRRRAQAVLDRLTALRCRLALDGLVGYREIGGTLADTWEPDGAWRLDLLDGDDTVATVELAAPIASRDPTAVRRFTLSLPETLLDDEVHRLALRVVPFGGVLGPWSYLLARPRSPDELLAAVTDPVWDTLPAVVAARRARRKARRTAAPAEIARLALDDALADAEAIEPEATEEAADAARIAVLKAHFRLGEALRVAGDWADAAAQFRAALAIDGEDLDALSGLVRSLLDDGNEAAADAALNEALDRLPDEGALHALADELRGRRRAHRVRTLAFYLPQFHPTPENDAWWGEGFTEWHNVGGATPLFAGHLQPRRPTALGYYDLRLPEAANAQFELARRYGIDGFCYYYYWFEGRRILEKPLDDLVAGRTGPFPFCICWANEDWTRSWDGSSGEVLLAQNHAPDADFAFIQDVAPLLRHPDYVRVDGKPMLLIYRADRLSTPKETVERWRAWCRGEGGIGEIHLCAVQSFGFHDPRPLGFDAAVEFPPHCPWERYPKPGYLHPLENLPETVPGFSGVVYDYQAFARAAMKRPREPFALHRTAMVAWDNTARRGKTAAVYHRFSLETFHNWVLFNARRAAVEQEDGVCFVNAWNEWAEGSVMEPDTFFGHEILESTRRATLLARHDPLDTYWRTGRPLLPTRRLAQRERMLLIGHDAFPSGAQTNMLNMARCLKRQLDIDVTLMLVEGGELLPEFERVAPTYVIGKTGDWRKNLQDQLRQLATLGARKAICNTVITGDVAEVLKAEGFGVVGLLHELPALIEAYGLQGQCWRFADKTDAIVCASQKVADEFCHRYWPDPKKVLIAPQGIAFNRHHGQRDTMRAAVREELSLPEDCRLVIGCGYGDTRKGIDLFVRAAGDVVRGAAPGSVAFVWVGALDAPIAPYVHADVERLGLDDAFRITGRTTDAGRYFIAADVFALTSREDPFPSVVMEAFDAGLPVVAFDGGGGYVDIVGPATGALVPYLDVAAMAATIGALLADPDRLRSLGESNHRLCRERFGYVPYMRKLLALLAGVPAEQVAAGHLTHQAWFGDRPRPTITAIVPNYNYARYLELRLSTVIGQTLPPDRIVVLDDGSTDHSLEVIRAVQARSPIPIELVAGEANSGNPFVQWAKGLALAQTDLVWIAEADDYCEPTLLETLAREMADERVVMAWADSVMVDEDGRSQGAQYKEYYARQYGAKWRTHFRMAGRDLTDDCLLTENVVPNASAVLFRRAAVRFDLAPIQRYRFSGDWWFWLSLAREGDVVYRADPLNYHRRHKHSVMGDVLRAGESLLPETMGFYERVVAAYPDCVTPGNARAVLRRLDGLYAMFPALQQASPRLREHPGFAPQWQRVGTALAAALPADGSDTRGQWLVLSADVMEQPGEGLRRLLEASAGPDRRVVLLADAAQAEAFSREAGLGEEAFTLVDVRPTTGAIGARATPAAQARAFEHRLAELLAAAENVRIVSHGLLAHCAVDRARGEADNDWTIAAGSEFDALLGRLPASEHVNLDALGQALRRCSRVTFLGESVPHALGRLAQPHLRPLERWTSAGTRSNAERGGNGGGRKVLVGIGAQGTPETWQQAVRSIAAAYPDPDERPLLRLLAWGCGVVRLRTALCEGDDVEVVDTFGCPMEPERLGDCFLLLDAKPAIDAGCTQLDLARVTVADLIAGEPRSG